MPMSGYQVSHCNQVGLKLLLFLMLVIISWQALSPSPAAFTNQFNDKIGHLLVFLLLAALADHAYANTTFNLTKSLWLLSYGLTIEVLQHFIPEREFSLLDLLADAVGIGLYAITAIHLLKRTPTPPRNPP